VLAILVALAAAAIAFVIKLALNTASGQDVGYSVLVLAVATAALAAGFWSGILTAIIGAVADTLYFWSTGGSFFAGAPGAFVRFLIFVPTRSSSPGSSLTRLERAGSSSAERFRRLIDDSRLHRRRRRGGRPDRARQHRRRRLRLAPGELIGGRPTPSSRTSPRSAPRPTSRAPVGR
jgi:hypothetical protein